MGGEAPVPPPPEPSPVKGEGPLTSPSEPVKGEGSCSKVMRMEYLPLSAHQGGGELCSGDACEIPLPRQITRGKELL
jgi:hypothetical protein